MSELHNNIKATKEYWIDKETPWEPVAEGLSRQIMGYDDKIMLVKAKFETGAVGQLHKHYHSQVTYVASGEFEMTIGDDVRIIRKEILTCLLYTSPSPRDRG